MYKVLFSIFLWLATTSISGQTTLHGTVRTPEGKPLAGASIFISNTSIGTVTNDRGEFALGGIPSGRYILVISSVGYQTDLETIDSRFPRTSFDITLRVKATELGAVNIRAFDKNGYKKWGELFRENFIGTSDFSGACRILNPEVIRIHYAPKSRTLTAFTDGPMLVENRALGYDVQVTLDEFHYDMRTGAVFYSFFPLFKPMVGSASKESRWAKNRASAFYGSPLHFFRALYQDRLADEGFELKMVGLKDSVMLGRLKNNLLSAYERARDSADASAGPLSPESLLGRAFLDQYDQRLDELWENSPTYEYPGEVRPSEVVVSRDSNTMVLSWPQILRVTYLRTRPPDRYFSDFVVDPSNPESGRRVAVSRKATDGMTTQMQLMRGFPMEIFSNGSNVNTDLLYHGYWTWWQKIGNLLPYDYVPPVGSGPSAP